MILSDKTIKKMLASGELVIKPITEHSIQPASVDCRLGDHFLVVEDSHMQSDLLRNNGSWRNEENLSENDEARQSRIESDTARSDEPFGAKFSNCSRSAYCARGLITLDTEIKYREIEGDSIIIPSQSFLLATTEEYLELPDNLTAFVEGRSSIGRIGLFIQNAGWVDPGFKGKITLELYNANSLPIKLQKGRRVCQLVFCKMDDSAESPYNGKYQGQITAMGSRVFRDKEV